MAFPVRKLKRTSKEKRDEVSGVSEKSVPTKRSLGGLFKRKIDETATLSKDEIATGLNRALRVPKIKTTDSENRSRDLEAAREALVAIEMVLYAMDKVRDVINQSLEITESAASTDDMGARALLAEKYDELRLSVDQIASETDGPGARLINTDGTALDVEMTGHARYSIACFRMSTDETALNLTPPLSAFADDVEITETKNQLQLALNRVERATASYCRDAKFVMARIGDQTGERPAPRGLSTDNTSSMTYQSARPIPSTA